MSKKKNHRILKAVGITAAAGACAYAGSGYVLFRRLFDLTNSPLYKGIGVRRLSGTDSEKNEWFAHSVREDDFLDSYDGLKLHAMRIVNHSEDHKWMIVQHGAADYSGGMLDLIYEADHNGYNVLAPDSRGCGMSEGQYTGLGWMEHYDLISWINYLITLDPEAKIAVYGADTGAAAVMNAAGDYLPSNVKCLIEDGGFSGIKEYILNILRTDIGIDGKLLIPGIDFYVKQILHFSVNDVSIRRQLTQGTLPMLFMHGTQNELIPSSMVFDNYYAYAGEKDLYMIEGGRFGERGDEASYYKALFGFAEKYIG